MSKIFRRIGENNFEPAPGGSSGTLNYSVGYGTPSGGNVTQNPDNFGTRDLNKAPAHGENQDTGSMLAKLPERQDRKSSSGAPIHPGEMADQGDFENSTPGDNPNEPNTVSYGSGGPLPVNGKSFTDMPDSADPEDYYPNGTPPGDESNDNQSQIPGKEGEPTKGGIYQNAVANKDANPDNKEFDKDVDQMFQKKITPTPDELMSALQYEMNQMVKKDKYIAKSIVLKNLKEDPKYYSRLNMLNIDDDKMKVDESLSTSKVIFKTTENGEDIYWANYNSNPRKSVLSGRHSLSPQVVKDLIKKGYQIMDLTNKNNGLNETTFEKTKLVLDKMIAERQSKARPVQNSNVINNIFKDLWDKRYKERNRK